MPQVLRYQTLTMAETRSQSRANEQSNERLNRTEDDEVPEMPIPNQSQSLEASAIDQLNTSASPPKGYGNV